MRRRSPLTILLLAVCLLPAGIGAGMSAHSAATTALRGELANKASEQADVLDEYFLRAQAIDLLTAHNPAFAHFYGLPGRSKDRIRRGGQVVDDVNGALRYLEELYPDAIGEACFIDQAGPEIARVVNGERARVADLSPDESGNPFFKPTFALSFGQVYQASPYVSPDTGDWVISNSTLLPTRDGAKRAIVHFEITIESFRKAAAQRSGQDDVAVVDARSGAVIFDSRYAQAKGAKLGRPGDQRFSGIIAARKDTGFASVGGRAASFQRLKHIGGNANDWYVVAVARTPAGGLYGVGRISIVLVILALALLAVGAFTYRSAQRELVDSAREEREKLDRMREAVAGIARNADALTRASAQLGSVSDELGTSADRTSAQADQVARTAADVSASVQSVAHGTTEMGSAIQEISRTTGEATAVVDSAVQTAQAADAKMGQLSEASAEIGQILKVITSIAGQTNLLALNATIEAARAGEHGKGFAVVAGEVKELARETAKATEDISHRIAAIQGSTTDAASAIREIGEIVQRVNDAQATIAAAVEEQSVTAQSMGLGIAEAASGSGQIAEHAGTMAAAAESTAHGAGATREAAAELTRMATELRELLGAFSDAS